jgi:hypothetical protein
MHQIQLSTLDWSLTARTGPWYGLSMTKTQCVQVIYSETGGYRGCRKAAKWFVVDTNRGVCPTHKRPYDVRPIPQ